MRTAKNRSATALTFILPPFSYEIPNSINVALLEKPKGISPTVFADEPLKRKIFMPYYDKKTEAQKYIGVK
jgi:hypothetical protein